jgi:hypothetical protein
MNQRIFGIGGIREEIKTISLNAGSKTQKEILHHPTNEAFEVYLIINSI